MILHISHNDLDGVTCGALTKKFIKDVDNMFCNYNEIDAILEEVSLRKYDQILITDMSPSQRAESHLRRDRGSCDRPSRNICLDEGRNHDYP